VPSLDDIALTVAAAELGNFGAVARTHNVSQSTVSRAVQRVEAEAGPLFARSGRSVETLATPAARATLTDLQAMLACWEQIHTRSDNHDHLDMRLSIFCTVTASQTIAPELLGRFRTAHPGVELDLRTGPASQALEAAQRGDVDAAIAPLPRRPPAGMAFIHLHTTEFVAISSGDSSWVDAKIIVPRSGLTRSLVDTWCRASLDGAWTVQETDTHEEAVALATVGFGTALVPKLVLDASPLRDHLRTVPPPMPLPRLDIGLCALRRRIATAPLSMLWGLSPT
jgi:LysR family transcriptional regulator, positive regulator for ilvC